jgi:predicted nucleic acid-binding Zn ribbon protein
MASYSKGLNRVSGLELVPMNEPNDADSVSPLELPGSANTLRDTGRQLHQRDGQFGEGLNDDVEVSPGDCEVCGCAIPPNRSRCPDHTQETSKNSTPQKEWKLSRVGLALVPGVSAFHAAALASTAFKNRDDGQNSKESFELVYDFGDPSQTLTSGWGGELPDVVRADSELGTKLLEVGFEKTADRGETLAVEEELGISESPLGESEGYVFGRGGDRVTSFDDVDELGSSLESNEDLWVVPGVLLKKKIDTGDSTVKQRTCSECDRITKHVFDGYKNGHPAFYEDGAGKWICLECESVDYGEAPVNPDVDEPWNDENFAGGDPHLTE